MGCSELASKCLFDWKGQSPRGIDSGPGFRTSRSLLITWRSDFSRALSFETVSNVEPQPVNDEFRVGISDDVKMIQTKCSNLTLAVHEFRLALAYQEALKTQKTEIGVAPLRHSRRRQLDCKLCAYSGRGGMDAEG